MKSTRSNPEIVPTVTNPEELLRVTDVSVLVGSPSYATAPLAEASAILTEEGVTDARRIIGLLENEPLKDDNDENPVSDSWTNPPDSPEIVDDAEAIPVYIGLEVISSERA